MALFGNKDKKARMEDEFGDLREEFVTDEEYRKSHLIDTIHERSAANRRLSKTLRNVTVGGVAFLALFSIVSGPAALFRSNVTDERIDTLQSPAFKTRYDARGAEVIRDYFAHNTPSVNLTSNVNWAGYLTTGGASGQVSQGSAGGQSGQGGDGASVRSAPVQVQSLSFVSGEQVPFIMSPDDMRELEGSPNGNPFNNPVQENLVYTGVIDGEVYTFHISFIIPDIDDPSRDPYLASNPTIMPHGDARSVNIPDGSVPPADDPMFEKTDIDSTTQSTINDWVSAYAAGDSAAIKRLTGDNDPTNMYRGLGEFSLIGNSRVVWAYNVYPDGDRSISDPATLVRINFQLQSNNSSLNTQQSGSGSQEIPFAPTQSMDILLTGANTGIPNVVAWTADGNWKGLSTHMNAEKITASDMEAQATGTTPSSGARTGTSTRGTGTTTSGTTGTVTGTTTSTPRSMTGDEPSSVPSGSAARPLDRGEENPSPQDQGMNN